MSEPPCDPGAICLPQVRKYCEHDFCCRCQVCSSVASAMARKSNEMGMWLPGDAHEIIEKRDNVSITINVRRSETGDGVALAGVIKGHDHCPHCDNTLPCKTARNTTCSITSFDAMASILQLSLVEPLSFREECKSQGLTIAQTADRLWLFYMLANRLLNSREFVKFL
jgi:hypothetical protein